ncbi:MAG: 4-alpha-glucanotransferase, partial [Gammaproteobacteria bacterium]
REHIVITVMGIEGQKPPGSPDMRIRHIGGGIERVRTQYELYDAIRIDHFPGLVRYWQIPASEITADNGQWVSVPGRRLLQILTQLYPSLQLIAEDLGTITPEILALRDEFSLPGMLVLQFAFDGSQDNPYLPKHHTQNSVVYTATHDNNTTLGWYNSLSDETNIYVRECIDFDNEEMPWPMIRTALESQANLAMLPMQDILGLGEGHRMNTPGTTENNWQWRFKWQQIDEDLPTKLSSLLKSCKRKIAS